MIWLVLLILLVTIVALVQLTRQVIEPEVDSDAEVRAAIDLHAIQSRLLAARTRRETRRDADAIRRQLMRELDAMSPSDYQEPRS